MDDREASLRGLGKLARRVFVDRNASGWNKPGMPKGDRLAIKAEARPFLREAIRWLRKSRDALLAGDIAMYELLLDRARMYRAFAALEFFQRYANKYGDGLVKIASLSESGHKKKAEIFERDNRAELKEFDNQVRGCIAEATRTASRSGWTHTQC